ncbi:MAG: PqqD family protein [Solirubrobacterales bacterium]|nr:PqqD family protein [Solirubrobacterales bacterium]
MNRFQPKSPPVIYETIDNETIIVNLEAGVYYALNLSGSAVWTGLAQGASVAELVQSASQRGAPSTVEESVNRFVEELVAEDLIVARESSNGSGGSDGTPDSIADWPQLTNFEAPTLNRYTDMQELLLLDPVHDVGVGGWVEEG